MVSELKCKEKLVTCPAWEGLQGMTSGVYQKPRSLRALVKRAAGQLGAPARQEREQQAEERLWSHLHTHAGCSCACCCAKAYRSQEVRARHSMCFSYTTKVQRLAQVQQDATCEAWTACWTTATALVASAAGYADARHSRHSARSVASEMEG